MISNKQTLEALIKERLAETTKDIFALFEQAAAEYQREIDRLKKVIEAKQEPPCSSGSPCRPEAAPQPHGHERPAGLLVCKEETEPLVKEEDMSHILITNVEPPDNTEEELPEASYQSLGPDWLSEEEEEEEEEEEDSDTDSHASKTFRCPVCNKRFTQVKGMKLHMRRAHVDEEPLAAAEYCTEKSVFSRADDEPGPFVCSVCKVNFRHRFSLEAHMRKHTGGNPFYCIVCVRAFANHYDYIWHIKKVHSPENPYKCSVCSRALKNSRNFKSHMMTHTGERPFRCSVCGRGFLQTGNLKYHMLTHTGEKPFSCSDCGVRYTSKQNLMNHRKANH